MNGPLNDFEGVFYTTKYSEKTHAITISIKSLDTFEVIQSDLKDRYEFTKNKNNNGFEAHFTQNDKNVTLTLYNNKTLFVQGAGCWLWKSRIFDTDITKLLETNMEIPDSESDNTITATTTPETSTPVTSISGSKSPIAYLSSMISSLRQSRSRPKSSQDRSSVNDKSLQSTPRRINRSRSVAIGQLPAEDNGQTFIKEPFKSSCVMNESEQTVVKELFRGNGSEDSRVDHDASVCEDSNKVTQNAENQDTTSTDKIRSKQAETESLLSAKTKENTVLQETLKELLTQSKLLKAENNKLLALNASKDNDIKMLQSKIRGSVDKVNELDHELSRVKADLADANAQLLIHAEDNKKIQRQVNDISKEKSELLDELMKIRGSADEVENKIEKSAEYVEKTVVGEIKDLKTLLLKEISDLRSQINKSKGQTKEKSEEVRMMKENKNQSTHTDARPIPVIVTNKTPCQLDQGIPSKKKTAFVAGDSITRILSPARMCDSTLEVKVRSRPGGRINNIENTLKTLSQSEPEFMNNLDVVVLHVGTNNVSDAESGDQIVKHFKNLIGTLYALNQKTKVILSSILPRRNDRLVNEKIFQTNKALQKLCDENGHHFLDNSVNIGNPSQYRDNLHLNPRGGKVLGNNMTSAIGTVLGLSPVHETSHSEADDTSFRKGRSPGRREIYQSRRHMYFMPMPPYWMGGGQSPWPFQNHAWY